MKIAISQLNYTVGDFSGNTAKIIEHINKAKEQQADLIIFSELAICGTPALDLLQNQTFIDKSQQALQTISAYTHNIIVIAGVPLVNNNKLFNSAVVIENREIIHIANQMHLLSNNTSNDHRYFAADNTFKIKTIKEIKTGIIVGNDIETQLFSITDNAAAEQKLDLLINIAAKPFYISGQSETEHILTNKAKKYNCPVIHVNQVGANSDILFEGSSTAVNSYGETVLQLKSFEEDFVVFDYTQINKQKAIDAKQENPTGKLHKALTMGIRDFFAKNSVTKTVIGLSGGLDSAVVAVLATQALGAENVKCILMPSAFSSDHSVNDAIKLANKLKLEHHTLSIQNIFEKFNTELAPIFSNNTFGLTEENLQARIRGVLLMAYSNKTGCLVLNTSNKSEFAVGYSTMYGDGIGAFSVLGDVYKTDVYKLAEYINRQSEIIPQHIISKPPSAELRPNQQDSDSLPDYDTLDKILFGLIEQNLSPEEVAGMGFKRETVNKTVLLLQRSTYKRAQAPMILRVSKKAFGQHYRIPLVCK